MVTGKVFGRKRYGLFDVTSWNSYGSTGGHSGSPQAGKQVHQQWFEPFPSQTQDRNFLFLLPVLNTKEIKKANFLNLIVE
jgi:hypothetical protein